MEAERPILQVVTEMRRDTVEDFVSRFLPPEGSTPSNGTSRASNERLQTMLGLELPLR